MNTDSSRPWTVTLACVLSLAISIWDIVGSVTDQELVESLGLLAFVLALSVVPLIFTFAAFHRRNWGRIVLAVITALGIVSVPVLMLLDAAGPVDAETVIYAVVDIAATGLLFVPTSSAWYRQSLVEAV